MHLTIRLARPSDAAGIREIYAPFVCETMVSFETEVPSVGEMARRIDAVLPRHPWLVVDQDGTVAGYAYASRHRDRAAYDWSVDVSAYVRSTHHRRGVGRGLYTALLEILRAQGFHRAYAGIALPNAASVGLHEALGFGCVGVYRQVGWKHGAWHDVGWWECRLGTDGSAPRVLRSLEELSDSVRRAAIAAGQMLIRS